MEQESYIQLQGTKSSRNMSGAGIGTALIGGICLTVALTLFNARPTHKNPEELLFTVGAVFGLAGLYCAYHGIRGYRWQRKARNQPTPWMKDYPWNDKEIAEDNKFISVWFATILMTLIMAPFNWFAFIAPDGDMPILFKSAVGVFDALLLYMVYDACISTWQRLKYGRSKLIFSTFPFFLGERMSVRWLPRNSVRAEKLKAELRFVAEATQRRGKNRHTVFYQRYHEAKEIRLAPQDHSIYGIDITFDLPASNSDTIKATALSHHNPRYWELVITAETDGIDYHAEFLLPVYGRS